MMGEPFRATEAGSPLVVDVGLLISDAIGADARGLIEQGALELGAQLNALLSGFECRIHISEVNEPDELESTLTKLEAIVARLESRQFDFAVLASHQPIIHGSHGLKLVGVASQVLGSALFDAPALMRQASFGTGPVKRVLLDLFGALNGASDDELPERGESSPGPELIQRLERNLSDVADQRLEETPTRYGYVQFYARGLWLNKRELVRTLLRTRPWLFPARLAHLMAGAISATALIMLTAEAWELAVLQPWSRLLGLVCVSLGIAIAYLLRRQRLLSHLKVRPPTERRVTAEAVSVLGVSLGMITTFGALFVLVLALAFLVYPDDLVGRWSALPATRMGYAKMACWTANLGMVVGALGASLEAPESFRYFLVVDRQLALRDVFAELDQ